MDERRNQPQTIPGTPCPGGREGFFELKFKPDSEFTSINYMQMNLFEIIRCEITDCQLKNCCSWINTVRLVRFAQYGVGQTYTTPFNLTFTDYFWTLKVGSKLLMRNSPSRWFKQQNYFKRFIYYYSKV